MCYNWSMDKNSQNLGQSNLGATRAKSLIFDIGGIILDDSDEYLRKQLNLDAKREAELGKILFGPRWYDVMIGKIRCKNYMQELTEEHPDYAREIKFALSAEDFEQSMPLYCPNIELLKSLHQTGNYKMYWLSNMQDTEYTFLKERGILDLLDGGAYSCIEHCKKPEPQFYQILFDRYNLNPAECVFFDDRERNIEAGEQLGMSGELVPDLAALAPILARYQ